MSVKHSFLGGGRKVPSSNELIPATFLLFNFSFFQEDAAIRWMKLSEGELAYDPVTMNYLALRVIPEADIDEAIAQAEEIY